MQIRPGKLQLDWILRKDKQSAVLNMQNEYIYSNVYGV